MKTGSPWNVLGASALCITSVGCGKILGVDAYGVAPVEAGSSSGSDGSSTESGAPGPRCTLNTDCPNPLVCISAHCHVECVDSRDCQPNQRCTRSDSWDANFVGGVCEVVSTVCHYNSDCTLPLVCAADLQCRTECRYDVDCQAPQRCVYGVCAEPRELSPDGGLVGAVDAGLPDARH